MPAPTPLGPGVEEHSGDGGPSSASSDGDATHEGQREVTHSSLGPWTDVEWEEWRARRRSRYSWSPTTTTPSGGNGSVSANCEDDRIGVVTKSAHLNSQVKMTETAWRRAAIFARWQHGDG